jgi:RimJ/RimL family protein N-acetyltransferase
MPDPYWPLFDLRLSTPDLLLRPMTEADLPAVADLLPDDVDMDPRATRFGEQDPRLERGVITYQSYWRAYGTWTPQSWRLSFVVMSENTLVGAQELEGNDFPRLHTVDSASFLIPEVRGRGLGRQARTAVLALAFEHLGAESAITSAYHDNLASLGVSRSLGYQPNGESFEARGDGYDTLVHLRMLRAQWEASGLSSDVQVTGFEPCRPFFGLV